MVENAQGVTKLPGRPCLSRAHCPPPISTGCANANCPVEVPRLRSSKSEPTLVAIPRESSVHATDGSGDQWVWLSTLAAWGEPWIAQFWHTWELVEHDIVYPHFLLRQSKIKLRTDHLHAICHLLLLAATLLFLTYFLRVVLLPVILAAGIAVLLEPIVFLLVDTWIRCSTPVGFHGILEDNNSGSPSAPPSLGLRVKTGSVHSRPSQCSTTAVSRISMYVWCIFVVVVVIVACMLLVGLIFVWVAASIKAVNWQKYVQSERFEGLREKLEGFGIENTDEAIDKMVAFVVKAIGVRAIGMTMEIMSRTLLMVLFLGFFLVDSALNRSKGDEPWRPNRGKIMAQVIPRCRTKDSHDSVLSIMDNAVPPGATLMGKLRIQMRTFIRAKFILSLLKAILIGAMFLGFQIELWLLWTMLTFLFNFVPLGSSISTAAPILFVYFDPEKSFAMVVICVLWPLVVHNVVGNVVEPKMMAQSLKLHVVTVLLALTFWSGLWGVLGAVVCVPMTAMVRVFLEEYCGHPFAALGLALLEGKIDQAASSLGRQPDILIRRARSSSQLSCRNVGVNCEPSSPT